MQILAAEHKITQKQKDSLMEAPLLTIIVPAYNVERYISDCLDSLVNQTMLNHKVIIVNDGSTDGTDRICVDYAEKFPDIITYISQENRGLGAARNRAMPDVETAYTMFLDSDDWLNSLLVERLTALVRRCGATPDMIFTLPWIFNSATRNISPWMDMALFGQVFSDETPLDIHSEPRLFDFEVNACRKIYRTGFLRDMNFSFPEGVKWEDVRPHFQLLRSARNCVALKDASFYYRTNTGSQITSGTGKTRLDMIPVFEDTLRMCRDEGFSEEETSHVLRLIMKFSLWSIHATNSEYIKPLLKGLHKVFRKIPMRAWRLYFRSCSPRPRKDSLVVRVLRSPLYPLVSDRRRAKQIFMKLRSIKRRLRK